MPISHVWDVLAPLHHLTTFLCGQSTPLGHLSPSFHPKAQRHCSSSLLWASRVGCKPFKEAETFLVSLLNLGWRRKSSLVAMLHLARHGYVRNIKRDETYAKKRNTSSSMAVFEPASYWSWRTPAVPKETRDIYRDHATICNDMQCVW